MCEITIKVKCLHCASSEVKKNGKKPDGSQNFFCHGCKKQFQYFYKYQGADPRNKQLARSMAMRGSGIRDIQKVLRISICTVILLLLQWFSTIEEPKFEGRYRRVRIDEMWTFVGQRKGSKRWFWYAYCADSRKIVAFHIGKRNDSACKKLMKKLAHLDIKEYCTDDSMVRREIGRAD
jgi:insertion element IS1 protein InsB